MSVRVTNDRKDTQQECFRYVTLFGAFRECGILPGEEMVRASSTTSVIRTNSIPSGKQVRECGARVLCGARTGICHLGQ